MLIQNLVSSGQAIILDEVNFARCCTHGILSNYVENFEDWYTMYVYKVFPCPVNSPHDAATCHFKHVGENAGRRDPTSVRYSPTPCSKSSNCNCDLSHGANELSLHPGKYKTVLCEFPSEESCEVKGCYKAHGWSQLRAALGGILGKQHGAPRKVWCCGRLMDNPMVYGGTTQVYVMGNKFDNYVIVNFV